MVKVLPISKLYVSWNQQQNFKIIKIFKKSFIDYITEYSLKWIIPRFDVNWLIIREYNDLGDQSITDIKTEYFIKSITNSQNYQKHEKELCWKNYRLQFEIIIV